MTLDSTAEDTHGHHDNDNSNDNGITKTETTEDVQDTGSSSIFNSLKMEVEMTTMTKKNNDIKKQEKNQKDNNTASSSSSLSSLDDLLPPSKLYAGKRDDVDDDLDELLGIDMDEFQHREEEKKKKKRQQQIQEKRRRSRRIGRTIILSHTFYDKFQCCIIGPHWIGVLFTLTLLHAATYFFTNQALQHVGIISAGLCIVFHIISTSCLLCVSCVDPGIVKADDYDQPGGVMKKNQKMIKKKRKKGNSEYQGLMSSDTQDDDDNDGEYGQPHGDEENTNSKANQSRAIRENWRYCAMCNVYQPPKAVHCPECHVCVDGYDHHCPWMGCCVGKRNYKPFMMFNLSWLTYFLYVAIWVSFVGRLVHNKSKGET